MASQSGRKEKEERKRQSEAHAGTWWETTGREHNLWQARPHNLWQQAGPAAGWKGPCGRGGISPCFGRLRIRSSSCSSMCFSSLLCPEGSAAVRGGPALSVGLASAGSGPGRAALAWLTGAGWSARACACCREARHASPAPAPARSTHGAEERRVLCLSCCLLALLGMGSRGWRKDLVGRGIIAGEIRWNGEAWPDRGGSQPRLPRA